MSTEMRPVDPADVHPVYMVYKLGEPIHACGDCMHWSVVVEEVGLDGVTVVEYHQVHCHLFDPCDRCRGLVQQGHYCPECGRCNDSEAPESP